MPSEHGQSQSQTPPPTGPAVAHHRSTISMQGDSAATSPSGAGAAIRPPKTQKHHVQHRTHTHTHTHNRVPSSKGTAKLAKIQAGQDHGSNADLKKARNASATNLIKKNHSSSALKRNRSSADVPKAPKSPKAKHSDEARAKDKKKFTSVQFELGDEQEEEEEGDEDADAAAGWEEASSTASPVLSRTVSRSGTTKLNANGSAAASQRAQHPQSPSRKAEDEEPQANSDGRRETNNTGVNTATDAKSITERLLQRIPSYHTTTTKMSLATATPTTGGHTPSSSIVRTPQIGSKDDVVSRFVTGSGTPSDNSTFLPHTRHNRELQRNAAKEDVKRAQSMGNLTRPSSQPQPHSDESDEERAILPRSRKSSTSTPLSSNYSNSNNAYNPPQQSRTQQKLWLQRASSNIEPAQMTPGAGAGLVGDGRDPRIRLQLEKTGLEYLVVRRYQDPVGQGLRRLETLPGMAAAGERRIPKGGMRSARGRGVDGIGTASAQGSYEGQRGVGSLDGVEERQGQEEGGVDGVLRALWEKNYDLSASE